METIWGILEKQIGLKITKIVVKFPKILYLSIRIELFYFTSLGSTQFLLVAFGLFMGARLFPFQFFNSLHVVWNNVYSNSLCRNFDENNFSGIINVTNINTSHLVGEISLVNNSIIGLIPPWESGTYSPVL